MGPFHGEFGIDNSVRYHEMMLSDDRIKLSFHGHGHSHKFGELYGTGFDYLQVDNADSKNYILLTIQPDGSYEYERVFY